MSPIDQPSSWKMTLWLTLYVELKSYILSWIFYWTLCPRMTFSMKWCTLSHSTSVQVYLTIKQAVHGEKGLISPSINHFWVCYLHASGSTSVGFSYQCPVVCLCAEQSVNIWVTEAEWSYSCSTLHLRAIHHHSADGPPLAGLSLPLRQVNTHTTAMRTTAVSWKGHIDL